MIYLKNVRESKHMSVDELAAKTMLSKQTIWAYERGGRNPDPTALCVLADALDCSLDMLVRGKEKDRPRGRSVQSILDEYGSLSSEEINLLVAVLQTELANRAFQAHLRQEKEQI